MRISGNKGMWFFDFLLAMLWLGVCSFIVCSIVKDIHIDFKVPQSVLGITVVAIGSAIPNFYASILMAKDGRADMAIGNALGSNVQNVFIALGLPWCAYCLTSGQSFKVR